MPLTDCSFEFHKGDPFWMYHTPESPFVMLLVSEEQDPEGRASALCGGCVSVVPLCCAHVSPFSAMSRAERSFCPSPEDHGMGPGMTVLRGWDRAQTDLTVVNLLVTYVCPSRTKAHVT